VGWPEDGPSKRSHKRLLVWQMSVDLATDIYELTRDFPSEERFGISQQMRRAAVSIASNISEGAGRQSSAEKVHFFSIAQGSLNELDTQLEMVKKLKCDLDARFVVNEKKIGVIGPLLSGLIRSRKNKS
jgi:four helix bundle protein